MTLELFADLPESIEPLQNCEALVVTCLTAPAETIGARGLEVIYGTANGWTREIRP